MRGVAAAVPELQSRGQVDQLSWQHPSHRHPMPNALQLYL